MHSQPKHSLLSALFILGAVSLLPLNAAADVFGFGKKTPQSRSELTLSFAPVVKKTAPAVVNVYSRKVVQQRRSAFFDDPFFRRFFGDNAFGMPRKKVQRSLGSGVIVDPSGIVVTNDHVIKDGYQIKVSLSDGREFDAGVILRDKKSDLAVLGIKGGGASFAHIQFGDSDAIEVGDLVLAIGNPFGVGQTVTSGIISAVARARSGISDYQFFIQTDAAINPGNSGGALIGMNGKLIGINTAIYSRSGGSNGIGFAIPVNMVRTVVESAKNGKVVRHPWLGARVQKVTPAIAESLGLAKPSGVLVGEVYPGGPSDVAGLKRSDIIAAIGGRSINSPQALQYRIATGSMGKSIGMELLRRGRKINTKLVLAPAPEIPARTKTRLTGGHPLNGAVVANLSPALSEELTLKDSFRQGVVVLSVPRDSEAARLRLQRGDIVLEVNRHKVGTVSALQSSLNDEDFSWAIAVQRGNQVLRTVVGG